MKDISRKLIPIGIVLLILTISLTIIAYGRGWRLDVTQKSVKPTGLVSATSQPSGAQVYIDNVLKTATNNAFNLDPGWYNVRIVKEGYLPWEKRLRIQGEVAVKIEATLFPGNPSLSPLTTSGVVNPTLSPDGTKVAYIVPAGSDAERSDVPKPASLLVLELSDRPLEPNRDPQLLTPNDPLLSATDVSLRWSPDSQELLVETKERAHLYVVAMAQTFTDVTTTRGRVLAGWETDAKLKEKQKLAGFPQEFGDVASKSATVLSFSPDEIKVLYQATASATIPIIIKPPLIASNPTQEARDVTPGKLYVYDSKEDKNFAIDAGVVPSWFPSSNHFILSSNNKIDIMEYDAGNRVTVYAGPFTKGFFAPWPNGSRLVILTNLNPGATTLPNLYAVNLR